MKTIYFILSATALLVLTASRCESDNPCPEDIICSMVFAQIDLQVKDATGKSVVLDQAEVSSSHFSETLDALAKSPSGGPYLIVNDSHMPFLDKDKARTVVFKGWKDGDLVVDEKFKIKHDCCHVVLEEGPKQAVIP